MVARKQLMKIVYYLLAVTIFIGLSQLWGVHNHNMPHTSLQYQRSVNQYEVSPRPSTPTSSSSSSQRPWPPSSTNNKGRPRRPVFVVLAAAYPRTGSTYLGQLLSSHPDAGFLYEPLHNLPTLLNTPPSRMTSLVLLHIVQELLNCRYSSVQYLFRSPRPLSRVMKKPKVKDINHDYYKAAEQACRSSSPRVIKLTRARLDQVTPLLHPAAWSKYINIAIEGSSTIPNIWDLVAKLESSGNLNISRNLGSSGLSDFDIRVVYLVRDPRAIMTSIYEAKGEFMSEQKDPKVLCEYMTKDLSTLKALGQEREKVKIIRYEDLVTHRIRVTKELYDFMNVPITAEVRKFVNEHSENNTDIHKGYYTSFKRSGKAIDRWKEQLPLHVKTYFEKNCFKLLANYGYIDK